MGPPCRHAAVAYPAEDLWSPSTTTRGSPLTGPPASMHWSSLVSTGKAGVTWGVQIEGPGPALLLVIFRGNVRNVSHFWVFNFDQGRPRPTSNGTGSLYLDSLLQLDWLKPAGLGSFMGGDGPKLQALIPGYLGWGDRPIAWQCKAQRIRQVWGWGCQVLWQDFAFWECVLHQGRGCRATIKAFQGSPWVASMTDRLPRK